MPRLGATRGDPKGAKMAGSVKLAPESQVVASLRANQDEQRDHAKHETQGGVFQVVARDVSDNGVREDADVGMVLEQMFVAAQSGKDLAVVIPSEAGACHYQAVRGLMSHLLHKLGQSQCHSDVLGSLKLLEYLAPEMVVSMSVRVVPTRDRGPIASELRVKACLFEPVVRSTEPSADAASILSGQELKLLCVVLDACKQAETVQLPLSSAADGRKVQRIADALGVTEARLLSEWARAGLHGPAPQVQFSQALYMALFDWALERVNSALNQTIQPQEGTGCWITVSAFPETEGQLYDGFISLVAQEALAQWCAELLPLQTAQATASMRPAAHELEMLQDTGFAYTAVGLFGEAGLLHYLSSGQRSPQALLRFVELIREGDLDMRRYFGSRTKDKLRIRCGDMFVPFDAQALSTATIFEPFDGFEIHGDRPSWLERRELLEDRTLSEQAKGCRTTKILRSLNELSSLLKTVAGEVVVLHARSERPRHLIPALVRLLQSWQDRVSTQELGLYLQALGLCQGANASSTQHALRGLLEEHDFSVSTDGEEVHFPLGKLRLLQRKLALQHDEGRAAIAPEVVPPWAQDKQQLALPKSWTTPFRGKQLAPSADFADTLPKSPWVKPTAFREARQMESVQGAMCTVLPMHLPDSRYKKLYGVSDDSSQLLLQTSSLMGSNQLFEQAIDRASMARGAMEKGKDEPVRSDFQHWLSDLGARVNPGVVRALNRVRARFRGFRQRKEMARLQRQHLAAAKIQLAWLECTRRRASAAVRIQAAYHSRVLRDIVRGCKTAKKELWNEENPPGSRRGGVQVPEGRRVELTLPGNSSRVKHEPLGRRIRKAVADWCAMPMDLVQNVEVHDTQRGLLCCLEVPVRVRHLAESLSEELDSAAARAVLQPVMDYLASGDGRHDQQDRGGGGSRDQRRADQGGPARGANRRADRDVKPGRPGDAGTDIKGSAKSPTRGQGAAAKAKVAPGGRRPSQLEMALQRGNGGR